jgi:hypothetical protein
MLQYAKRRIIMSRGGDTILRPQLTFRDALQSISAQRAILLDQAHKVFEPQLCSLKLGEEQILGQTLDELEQSLESVNEAIKNHEAFTSVKIAAVGELGTFAITNSASDYQFELNILPILLERKKIILDRIRFLKRDENLQDFRALIQNVADDELRTKLGSAIEKLEDESQKLQKETNQVVREQKQEELNANAEIAKLSIEQFERKSKVWLSFLARESVATIIGSFLLVIITITLIVAMFLKIPVTEIISSGFLLILGYFFGQTVSKTTSNT